jgi:hypothetical protein
MKNSEWIQKTFFIRDRKPLWVITALSVLFGLIGNIYLRRKLSTQEVGPYLGLLTIRYLVSLAIRILFFLGFGAIYNALFKK